MLELKNVSYSVPSAEGDNEIINNISLTVPDGTLLVLTGPNGGGKTTLAKAIMGIMPAQSGSIVYNGQDITNLSVTERARLGISYGFQQPPRFKGLRVSDLLNVAAGTSLSQDQACSLLTRVGLCANDYLNRDVDASLSGGEVKRIEIATILAKGPGLMIFDEPEAGIDLWSFQRLTDTFQAIRDAGQATLIIISHQERIIRLADEIILLDQGRIARKGPVAMIYPTILNETISECSYLGGAKQ